MGPAGGAPNASADHERKVCSLVTGAGYIKTVVLEL